MLDFNIREGRILWKLNYLINLKNMYRIKIFKVLQLNMGKVVVLELAPLKYRRYLKRSLKQLMNTINTQFMVLKFMYIKV